MASEWDVVSQTPVKGEWDVVSHTPTPPETPLPQQSTLGQIGQYVNERFNPSQETETWLQDAGVYNKPGENNPLKAIARVGVMNPIIGLFGGAAQTAGDAIHGGLKLVNDIGNAASPGLGRDLAGMAEMALLFGRTGASGKVLGNGLTIPNMNPSRRAANEVRASAIEKSSKLANDSRVAAGAEDASGVARAAAEDTAGVARAAAEDANGVTGVANATAQAARFGEESFFANKKAGQFGDAASRAAGAEAVAETPRSPVASPFGEPPSSAGIGQSVQSAAIDREARLRLVRGSDYAANTAEVQKAVDAKEARGIFLINDPEAQRMLKQSLRALDDTPIPGSPAAERLSASDRMAHEAVVSALKGQPVKIPESMVDQMRKEGHTVVSSPGEARPLVAGRGPNGQFGGLTPPTFSVTFSNTVDGVNNVRRMFGEAFNSNAVGWGAINSSLKKGIYRDLDNVLRSYVGDAYAARQAQYRAASLSIDAYHTEIGKQLIADQKGTTQPRKTANALADLLNQADPAVIDEVRKLSGIDPMPGIVARVFHDPVTGMSIPLDAALKATAPGTKLADALAAHPELNAAVIKHVSALKTEENATIQQSLFAQQQGAIYAQKLSAQLEAINGAKAATKDQTKAKELAEKLREKSEKDAANIRETSAKDAANIRKTSEKLAGELRKKETTALQHIANLERMSPKEVLPYARAVLEDMSPAKGGPLTMDQYTAALAQLDKAKSTADLQRRLLRIGGAGLAIAGTPAAGRVVYNSITGGP